jgi:hypothetical protein
MSESFFILDVDGRAVPRGDAHSKLQMNAANERSRRQENVKAVPYSTLPIFFTAAISRALSSVTNFENSGASM